MVFPPITAPAGNYSEEAPLPPYGASSFSDPANPADPGQKRRPVRRPAGLAAARLAGYSIVPLICAMTVDR